MSDKPVDAQVGQPSLSATPESFWDIIDENVVKANSGGGGYWGAFEVIWCWKVFPKGDLLKTLDPSDTIFPYDPLDKPGREAAHALAKAKIVELGLDNKAFSGVALRMRKENMLNKSDAERDAVNFTSAFKNRVDASGATIFSDYDEYVLPKLREFNLAGGVGLLYWGHLTFAKSHTPPKEGQKEYLCCFPDAVYPNRETCVSAMGTPVAAQSGNIPAPDGFDKASWEAVLPDLVKEITADPKKPNAVIARTWGIPVETIALVRESIK